jgi:hypothetical protein
MERARFSPSFGRKSAKKQECGLISIPMIDRKSASALPGILRFGGQEKRRRFFAADSWHFLSSGRELR